MTYPWNILKLSAKNADISAVKRAYAQQLKKCRPDEDAEGFQNLIQARDQALWLLKNLDIMTAHQSLENQQSPTSQASQDPELYTHAYFEKKLEEMGEGTADVWDISEWELFLNQLNQADFSCRQDIEWLVIQHIKTQLMQHQKLLTMPTQKDRIYAILFLLNEEFGWDKDDQKIYHVLGHRDADFMLGVIRSKLFNNASSPLKGEIKQKKIPYIALPDLRAYMGGEGEDIIHDYLEAWHHNKWRHSFNWSGFLFGYMWYAWRSFWPIGGVVMLVQILMVFMLATQIFSTLWESMILLLIIVGLPIFIIARYGHYLVITAAYKAIQRAEKKSFYNVIERYDYLQHQGQRSFLLIFSVMVIPAFLALGIVLAKS